MIRHFYILFCLCLLSCAKQPEEKPDSMVPKAKMVRILADIHTAEAIIERNVPYPDTALVVFAERHANILKGYQVKEQDFKKTYRYYLRHLDEMDKLYEVVVDTLSVRESKARAKEGLGEPDVQQAPEGLMPAANY
ncbi:DUF4296 domain-containing protein [Pontibacter sp. CAU 1760]